MKDFCIWYRRLFLVALVIVGMFTVVPLLFGYHGYAIETGSMEPTIPTGSAVYVKRSELMLNDVITYRMNDKMMTHRIVGIDEANRTLITKGDANKYNDDYKVAVKEVVGKVDFFFPIVGWLILYLQSLEGRIASGILLIVFVFCIFYKGSDEKNES